MKIFGKNYDDKKVKKIAYTAVYLAIAFWFVFRFVMVAMESRMVVFNPIRVAQSDGIIVETVLARQTNDVIKIPIDVKNNRAYVSGEYRNKLHAGQKIDDGEIISVSSSLDFAEIAAGDLIVRESGGKIEIGADVVATNGKIAE